MHRYEIAGTGIRTGRKRKRVYAAATEEAARKLAEKDETDIETVRQLPPEPPTDRQLEYARDLGIEVPGDASKADVSAMISRAKYNDKEPTERHWRFAELYEVAVSKYSGKKMLFSEIHAELSKPGREADLIEWFAFRVYRGLVQGADDAPLDSPKDDVFHAIAEELASDEKIVESIRRYEGHSLIWFGQWTTPDGYQAEGGSKRTIAYKRVAALLEERVELPKPVAKPRGNAHRATDETGTDVNVGVANIVIAVVVCIVVLWWLAL